MFVDEYGLAGQILEVTPGVFVLGRGIDPNVVRTAQPVNASAADTINADRLRSGGDLGLALTGAGRNVGIWEADACWPGDCAYVLATHQELVGRVTAGDGGGPSSSHATHVAGTVAATGVGTATIPGPAVQGMANEAQLVSFDTTDYLTELNAAIGANSLAASNHSWSYTEGWTLGTFAAFAPDGQPNVWRSQRDVPVFTGEDPEFGQYGEDSRDLDAILRAQPNHLAVFSAGDDGPRPAGAGSSHAHYTNAPVVVGGTTLTNVYVSWFAAPPVVLPPDFAFLAGVPNWWLVPTAQVAAPPDDGDSGTGFDNLPSGGQTAKNALTVGAVRAILDDPITSVTAADMASFSSWGPTDDGRVKPDVVADGIDVLSSATAVPPVNDAYSSLSGTSIAAPSVTGASVLLMQHYSNLHGTLPTSATTKGVILHTAVDGGNPGPDYSFGWGLMNSAAAANFLSRDAVPQLGDLQDLIQDSLDNGTQDNLVVDVAAGRPLKATLVWTDPAGTARSGQANLDNPTAALVNDLDLTIIGPGGTTFFPWTLDPGNPGANAVRTQRNAVDNVEQVLIDAPVTGTYTIRVSHTGPLQGGLPQNYSLLISAAAPLDPDAFEPNNTTADATVLGSEEQVTLRGLTIHDANDVDVFRVTAANTGKLIVNAWFLHDQGNLDLRIRDVNGNVIATAASTDDNEQLVLPVVSQRTYYVEIFGANQATNAYALEIENFAAPVPDFVDLPARSLDDPTILNDTGISQSDDVTNRVQPDIVIEADLFEFAQEGITILTAAQVAQNVSGAAVEVFVNGQSVGFADPIAATGNTLFRFRFGAGALPVQVFADDDGGWLHYVKAAVRIFDGQRNAAGAPAPASGRTQLSQPLLLVIDTVAPPITITGIAPYGTDTGVAGLPETISDRITSDTATGFLGDTEGAPWCG